MSEKEDGEDSHMVKGGPGREKTVLCGIWIFCDYGFTFASVFTLVVISLDRLWSVTWAMHYHIHNTKRKSATLCGIVWIAMVAVWFAPCIMDRVNNSTDPEICIWEPSKNPEFVIFIAVVGHHLPCFIMVGCYIKVFAAMRKRNSVIRPQLQGRKGSVTAIHDVSPDVTITGTTMDHLKVPSESSSDSRVKKRVSAAERERKIFITLTYILVSYLLCWVPFHIVFDLSAIRPDLVPNVVYSFTFYLTYFNSTLNPILYAFSSVEFRAAFHKALLCRKFK